MHETMVEIAKRKLIDKMARYALEDFISEAMFKYASINGINLKFTFTHPGAKQIFEMNKESIKAKLREFWADNVEQIKANDITFRDISCEIIYRLPRDGKALAEERKPYEEPSSGSFENKAKNPVIKLAFEKIRKAIKTDLESGKSVYVGGSK